MAKKIFIIVNSDYIKSLGKCKLLSTNMVSIEIQHTS